MVPKPASGPSRRSEFVRIPPLARIRQHEWLLSLLTSTPYVGTTSCFRVAAMRIHAALVLSFIVPAAIQKVESIAVPGTKAFPESITSSSDGALFVGRVGDGGIVRVEPRTGESTVFVQPGTAGSRSILGVFADEASNTLWACSNDLSALGAPAKGSDTGSAMKAFDLRTGNGKRSVSLPGPHAYCNDITVDSKGSVYITDSANPTVLKLSVGAAKFDVFAQDSAFSAPQSGGAGLDGIAFGSNGNLYVTICPGLVFLTSRPRW